MEKRSSNRNKGAALPTLAAFFAALAGSPLILVFCRLTDRFADLGASFKSMYPLAMAGLFVGYTVLEGAAAGLLSAAFEKRPLSFLPHITAPLIFAASMGLGWLILGRAAVVESLMTLIFYISGFLLFRARSKKQGKKTCVLFAAVPAIAVTALVFLLRAVMLRGGNGSPIADTAAYLEDQAAQVGKELASGLRNLAGSRAEALLRQTLTDAALAGKTVEEGYELLGEAYGSTLKAMLYVLPAIAAAAMTVFGFIAASVCNKTSIFGREKPEWQLTVSGVGTLIFVISMFATTLFVSLAGAGGFGLFLYSMRILFLPAFTGVGVGTICDMRRKLFGQHALLTVLCGIMILLSPLVTLPLIGVYGNMARIVNEKKKQMNGGGGPDIPKL